MRATGQTANCPDPPKKCSTHLFPKPHSLGQETHTLEAYDSICWKQIYHWQIPMADLMNTHTGEALKGSYVEQIHQIPKPRHP